MGCEQAFEDDRVARYLSGEVSEPERDAFEIHVLECEACRAALEAHLDLTDALRAAPPRSPCRRCPSAQVVASRGNVGSGDTGRNPVLA